MSGLTRCVWSVGSRTRPQGYCGRKTVDGTHCAQHAKMAAQIEKSNASALDELKRAFPETPAHD